MRLCVCFDYDMKSEQALYLITVYLMRFMLFPVTGFDHALTIVFMANY